MYGVLSAEKLAMWSLKNDIVDLVGLRLVLN